MEITRRKKYSVTHWVISLRMMKILLTHRVTSPWVPLQLVPLVLYCSPAFEQKYHLYGFHYHHHDHHCHDCFQHHHLLHIIVPHFHFHPPMSCFCLNHLLLWRLGRSWWLSYWLFQELFAFTVFKISHSLWHVYHLSFINEIFTFCQRLSFVHLRWVTKGGGNHCHHYLESNDDVDKS